MSTVPNLPNRTSQHCAARLNLTDLSAVAFLIAIDVAARILPHAPDFTPVAATGVFAATVLRVRALSLLVSIGAMLVGDAVLGFYDWRMMAVVYAALALPAIAACLSTRLRRPAMTVPILLVNSLTFFVITNLAVWALSPIYTADAAGLLKCYIAALPFLKNMAAGDLFWGLVLFGSYGIAQAARARIAAGRLRRRRGLIAYA